MKNYKVIMAMVAIMAIGFGALTLATQKASISDSLTEVGKVCIYKNDVLVECTHNLITKAGMEKVKTALNGTVGNWNLVNLTLGGNTSAMAATDTDLANAYSANGLAPAVATYAFIACTGCANSSLNYQWTSSGAGTYNVNSTGIYNKTSGGGDLFSEASFTNVQLVGSEGDKINVTYYWWIT